MYDFLLDRDNNLFVNILTTLKNRSDLKWTLKSINIERCATKCQNEYLSNYQKKKILEHNIKSTIQNIITTNNTELDTIVNKAMDILEDLQSVKKYTVIRMMGYILIKILKSKLQGLYVNERKLIMIKSNFNKTPVIFIPSHRSYLDFILMAFVCLNYDIEIPYVAAAADFKNMKIMGTLLKNSGAFFLRRGKNAQDIIYRSVLYTYVKYLITYESSPVQFFIEGTRSRSNKSISPKLGILKCIVNVLLKCEIEDITIVPISINYDQLIEDKLYSYELLGIPKPKETTLGLINSIKNMDDNYGKIYINFSNPFSLQQYIEYVQTNENNNESHILTTLADEILFRQQHNMILSYFNILAVTLNYNLSKNMTEYVHLDIISDQINWISILFKKCGAQIETKDSDIKTRVIETVQLHRHFLSFKDNMIQFQKNYSSHNKRPFDISENLNCKTERLNRIFPLILNQLYVNPCLHFIINIAFITLVSRCKIVFRNNILDLERKFILLRRLFEFEFVLFDGREKQDFKNSLSIYLHINEKEKELLRCLVINPYVTCYRLIYNSLINTGLKTISEEYIYKSIRMKIQESHTHPYGLTENVIKCSLNSLNKMNIIEKHIENETTLYAVNKIIISELVQIFDSLMMNGNNLLQSKL